MRYRDAKKLKSGDKVVIKGTDRIEMVYYIEDSGVSVIVFTYEGSDYNHTEVQ